MARVRCPDCERLVDIPDEHEGTSIRCSSCGHKVILEDESRQGRDRSAQGYSRPLRRESQKENAADKSLQRSVLIGLIAGPVILLVAVVGLIILLTRGN